MKKFDGYVFKTPKGKLLAGTFEEKKFQIYEKVCDKNLKKTEKRWI